MRDDQGVDIYGHHESYEGNYPELYAVSGVHNTPNYDITGQVYDLGDYPKKGSR